MPPTKNLSSLLRKKWEMTSLQQEEPKPIPEKIKGKMKGKIDKKNERKITNRFRVTKLFLNSIILISTLL